MGNSGGQPAPSPFTSRPPGNWDSLFSVVVLGANVYHPSSVGPFVNGFRSSIRRSGYDTATHHILPRCCTLPVEGKRVRLELYTDNGACSSRGALVGKVLAERDGIAVVYDFTFAGSFEFARTLVQEIMQWRNDTTKGTPVILVGVDGGVCKSRKVEFRTAQQFAEQVSVPLVEVDLTSETDIESAHTRLMTMMMNRTV